MNVLGVDKTWADALTAGLELMVEVVSGVVGPVAGAVVLPVAAAAAAVAGVDGVMVVAVVLPGVAAVVDVADWIAGVGWVRNPVTDLSVKTKFIE